MMSQLTRKEFLLTCMGAFLPFNPDASGIIMTIDGPIPAIKMGKTLIHEHFLVDFIGADKVSESRWDREAVVKKVMPYVLAARQAGVRTIFDCTPAFLGRDIYLLQQLSKQSGIRLVTNTGYYGAMQNKFLPTWAFEETAEQLADRWIDEFRNGIQRSRVKPGFIKIGVDSSAPLSALHLKLIQAAAITHLKTGLTICSHTGLAVGAFEQLQILKELGVHPEAFVWVHAQAEENKDRYVDAARQGCWISLDGLGSNDPGNYLDSIKVLKAAGFLNKVLISHDAGWYKPDEPNGSFIGYTNIFTTLFPALKKSGFSDRELNQLIITNPMHAMSIQVRRYTTAR